MCVCFVDVTVVAFAVIAFVVVVKVGLELVSLDQKSFKRSRGLIDIGFDC